MESSNVFMDLTKKIENKKGAQKGIAPEKKNV